ncbi:DUF6183 family protein [Streptomyces chrestomyceticus]|uniref:DUF6183 family protein n=1 Tax=Streptomyces chrestomyceticus TaxID=68185 RepID=UPI0037966A21
MKSDIGEIVAKLPGMKDVGETVKLAERRLEAGDAAFVADLGIALSKRYGGQGGRMWQYRSLFDGILRLLTLTPGRENIEQGLRLVAAMVPAARDHSRYAASLLASSHPPQDLEVAFTGGLSHARASEELRACLVHELVLRGVNVTGMPGLARWAASPHWSHHPLRRLPLSLSAIEEAPALPNYHFRGGSWVLPGAPSGGAQTDPDGTQTEPDGTQTAPDGAARIPMVRETTTDAAAAALAGAVANWVEESNGTVEAKTFDLDGPVALEAVPRTLACLGLKSLHGLESANRPVISRCSPEYAWRLLFSAASTGGAYNHGLCGAYGRLAAWQSLGELSGAPAWASVAEVEQRVRACHWFSFGGATAWFQQVAWDIGLAAVGSERRRLAVLAATDTD